MDRIVDRRATLGAALASGIAVLAVLVLVVSGLATGPDMAVLRWTASLHGGPLDIPMLALSGLGVSSALAFFSAFAASLLWATGARRAGAFVLTTWIAGYVLTQALKIIVGRPRPAASFELPIVAPDAQGLIWAALAVVVVIACWRTRMRGGALAGAALLFLAIVVDPTVFSTPGLDSFPSGHALRTVVLVLGVAYVAPARPGRRTVVALGAVVVAIGISRVYLGEHHPSDVIAGWLAGVALVCALASVRRTDPDVASELAPA
jgi:membrane-associated phospholipid phosphatase